MSLPHGMETMSDWGVLLTRTQAKLHLKLNFKFDQKNSASPLQWKSSCWWSHRARGLLPPEGHLGSPGCSSGPWAPTHLLQSLSGSLSGLSPHSLVGSKRESKRSSFSANPSVPLALFSRSERFDLLPNADNEPGRFQCPAAGQRPEVVTGGFPCLQSHTRQSPLG